MKYHVYVRKIRDREGQTECKEKDQLIVFVPTRKRGEISWTRKKEMNALGKLRMRRKACFICSGHALGKTMNYLTYQILLLTYFLCTFLVVYILTWSKGSHLILSI